MHFEKECSRCTGHCCKAFFLPHSYETLQEGKKDNRWGIVNAQVPDMVIPLGKFKDLPDDLKAIVPQGSGDEDHYYTCKNYDTQTGNCAIYETRPAMCRDYPYGSSCKYKGCTRKVEPMELKKLEKLDEVDQVIKDLEADRKGRPGQRVPAPLRPLVHLWRRVTGRGLGGVQ